MYKNFLILYKREFNSFFCIPIAYIALLIFLLMGSIANFYFGNFFSRGQADLSMFFLCQPWLYAVFIPVLTMRSWAEEYKSGTIGLFYTLPISTLQIVLAKFFAVWTFLGLALVLTFPLWLAINYLGRPDNAAVFTCYINSLVLAGCFVAIGCCISALNKHQLIAYLISSLLFMLINLIGLPAMLEAVPYWLPRGLIHGLVQFGFLTHFDVVNAGLLKVNNLIYYFSLIGLAIFANAVVVESKKHVG